MVLTKEQIKEALKDDLRRFDELVSDIDKLLELELKTSGLKAYYGISIQYKTDTRKIEVKDGNLYISNPLFKEMSTKLIIKNLYRNKGYSIEFYDTFIDIELPKIF